MIIGMDFGTTNSGMAVYDGRSVTVLPLDPDSRNPRVARTALYVTNDQNVHIGRAAINRYYEQNVNRPIKMQRVWIGELEILGADMYYVTDAYAWVDVLSPGRLFLSIKSSLRDIEYAGTVVGQIYYPLEDLIALYLTLVKVRAEQLLGYELRQVVLGRPVHFAHDAEHDNLAQARLLQAAFRAGYEKVYLQYEPIAAAFHYETTLTQEQHALIFDFGGGTLDITVMRLGDRQRRQVLATSGIPVAGDVFDQKLVRAKLPKHFGEDSEYGLRHNAHTTPHWIYDSFTNWQKMLELQSAENKKILQEIASTSRRKYQIEALVNLVAGNYALQMFDVVEAAKRTLSERRGAEIRLEGPGFNVIDFVTRTEFESIIRSEIRAIDGHLDEVVRASGLQPTQIDAVIRTGGSSQVPAFYEMLCRKFGEEKVHSVDTFSSVTAGLGIIAQGVGAGEISLRGYTQADLRLPSDAGQHRPNISPVNLEVMRRRILLEEGVVAHDVAGDGALLFLDTTGGVTAVALPQARLQTNTDIPLAGFNLTGPVAQVLAARMDEHVLLITNAYRFLLFTPRQLLDMHSAGLSINNQYSLERLEQVCSLNYWDREREQEKLLLATSLGVARPYPLPIMRANVETPTPLKFDQPLTGQVVRAQGMSAADELLLVTAAGRGARWPARALRLSGIQALNCGQNDRVVAAVVAQLTDRLLLVTADGYGRLLQGDQIPMPPKVNSKGKALIARRSPVVGLTLWADEPAVWLATTKRLVKVEANDIPLDDSTKAYRLLTLEPDEVVQAVSGGQ
ncbi:MAG: Hsp70 family protein [Anaerolinea sp.]|nr:Hsp70 family protein [Anaerolinea sp.]